MSNSKSVPMVPQQRSKLPPRSRSPHQPHSHISRAQPRLQNKDRGREIPNEDVIDEDEQQDLKGYLLGLARDIIIAIVIMILIIGSLYLYTQNWPPMVVVESDSMMHGDDSAIGVIDTGDLVLVKAVNSRSEVKTYVEDELSNKKSYNTYGDVIIFRKNGYDDTPVIHRAVLWIEYNESGLKHAEGAEELGSFDIPSRGVYDVLEYTIDEYIPKHINLTIDFRLILRNFNERGIVPHGGFITKGDNNLEIDQTSLPDKEGHLVRPIKLEWIVGKAEGELPWFGLIKLYISGNTDEDHARPPVTSRNMLIISIALIVIIPIIIDVVFSLYIKRKKDANERSDKNKNGREPPPGTYQQQRQIQVKSTFQGRQHSFGDAQRPLDPRVPLNRQTENTPHEFTSKEDLFRKIK